MEVAGQGAVMNSGLGQNDHYLCGSALGLIPSWF